MTAAHDVTATQTHAMRHDARRRFWRLVLRLEYDKIRPPMALRNAVGMMVPLVLGLLFGHLNIGLVACLGAFNVSFSDGGDPYPQRAKRMLLACALVAAAVVTGAASGNDTALRLVWVAAWAFAAGLGVSLGTAAADLGLISTVTLIVFTNRAMPLNMALASGGIALLGGLMQTALSLFLWPFARYGPERKVLASLYRDLANMAGSPQAKNEGLPLTSSTLLAHGSLASLDRDHSIEAERYRSLLNQAERIRLTLFALRRSHPSAGDLSGVPKAKTLIDTELLARDVLTQVADMLDSGALADAAVNQARLADRMLALDMPAQNDLDKPRSAKADNDDNKMNPAAPSLPGAGMSYAAVSGSLLMALTGQLRASLDLAQRAVIVDRAAEVIRQPAPRELMAQAWGQILLANMTLRSSALRHGLRLAVCTFVGQVIGVVFKLPNAYWIPMTIVLVLKPDFSGTFSRGLLRLGGTLIGLGVATVLFHLLPDSVWPVVAMIALLGFAVRCWGPANYGIFAVLVTAFVVCLLALVGSQPKMVIAIRGIDTAIGGVVGLLAFAAWPTLEASQVMYRFAELLDAYGNYFELLNAGIKQPASLLPKKAMEIKLQARLARSNLEASIDRIRSEPFLQPEHLSLLGGMLASSHRLVRAFMAIEGYIAASAEPLAAYMPLNKLAQGVTDSVAAMAEVLRSKPGAVAMFLGRPPCDLRGEFVALARQMRAAKPQLDARERSLLLELDRVVNSANTLREQVERWCLAG